MAHSAMQTCYASGSSPSGTRRYLPMLKTKAGEIAALENLSQQAKSRILPVFHVCEEVKPSFVPQLAKVWAGRTVAVDGSFNFGVSGSPTTFLALVSSLRGRGVHVLPTWGMADPLSYQHSAAAAVAADGAVIKVTIAQLGNAAAYVQGLGLTPDRCDLVIDLKHLGSIDVASFAGYVATAIAQWASTLEQFRSITLASAAAPKDNGSLALGVNQVPRSDWQLWSAVAHQVSLRLDYGDYLTGHPDLTEPPGAAMAKATVSARYTVDGAWLIIKGRGTGGPNGMPMGTQYRAHAGTISNHPGFAGVPNVWADGQISQAAAGAPGMGSRAKWSGFAANRHISLVVDRLP